MSCVGWGELDELVEIGKLGGLGGLSELGEFDKCGRHFRVTFEGLFDQCTNF